jgi:transcriptional regulator with XRE-family HTH domain
MAGILRRNDYAFLDKHSIVDEIRTAIEDSGEPVEFIARSAGVHRATIDAWLTGKTRKPYSSSLEAVARALGKHLTLADGVMHLADPQPKAPPPFQSARHIIQMSKYARRREA